VGYDGNVANIHKLMVLSPEGLLKI
jgi:hypothetical protein